MVDQVVNLMVIFDVIIIYFVFVINGICLSLLVDSVIVEVI